MNKKQYGALLYKNGRRMPVSNLSYYYNKTKKEYLGVEITEETKEMFEHYALANNNKEFPEVGSIVVPLGNKALSFIRNDDPVLFNAGKQNLLTAKDYGFKDRSGDVVILPVFIDEFAGKIRGYQFNYNGDSYAVIYGEDLDYNNRKHLIRFLDKYLVVDLEDGNYKLAYPSNSYVLLIEHIKRKDARRLARKAMFKEIKGYFSEKDKEKVKSAIIDWYLLH